MNTSKKSDFIVNLTEKGFQKLCSTLFLSMIALMSLSLVPYYMTKNIVDFVSPEGIEIMLNERMLYLQGFSTTVISCFAFLVFLIAVVKKYIVIKKNPIFILTIVMFVLVSLSTIFSYDVNISTFGNYGRFEGLVAYLGYFSIFLCAMTFTNRKALSHIFDLFVGFAFIQSVIGILQHFERFEKNIPSYFSYIRNGGTKLFASNGFTGSPYALATFLTLALAISISGAIYGKCRIRKILYSASSIVFVVCGVFTYTLPAFIGIGSVLLAILIFEIVRLSKGLTSVKSNPLKNSFGIYIILAFIYTVISIYLFVQGDFKLYDRVISSEDGFYRLYISSSLDLVNEKNMFVLLWEKALHTIKSVPIFGSGADAYALYQTNGKLFSELNMLDRPYNEFLYIGASLGIPALLIFLSIISLSIRKGYATLKSFITKDLHWTKSAAFFGVIGYLMQAFFSTSSISTVFFWLLLGLLWRKSED